MQQPIPDEMKQEYARLPLFELIEGGERPPSVAESLVDYDQTKVPGSPGNQDVDGNSPPTTPKKGKRSSSGSRSSKRTPSPPKSPKGGKKGSKKEKESQPPIDLAQSALQDSSMKNQKPKYITY